MMRFHCTHNLFSVHYILGALIIENWNFCQTLLSRLPLRVPSMYQRRSAKCNFHFFNETYHKSVLRFIQVLGRSLSRGCSSWLMVSWPFNVLSHVTKLDNYQVHLGWTENTRPQAGCTLARTLIWLQDIIHYWDFSKYWHYNYCYPTINQWWHMRGTGTLVSPLKIFPISSGAPVKILVTMKGCNLQKRSFAPAVYLLLISRSANPSFDTNTKFLAHLAR